MAEISLNGVDAILDRLNSINANVGKLTNKALKLAAVPVLNDAKANAPVRTGKGRDGLSISGVKSKEGMKYILVGVDKSDNSELFYLKFSEFGTSKMPARPFLAPAFETNKRQVTEIIKNTLRDGLV